MDMFRRQYRENNNDDGGDAAADGATADTDNKSDHSDVFDVQWRPFQIDPNAELDGETFEEYCDRKGGSDWTKKIIEQGTKDGATFQNWKWWPATSKAHQLVQFCSTSPPAEANDDQSSSQPPYCSSDHINSLLFEAEYERGENISLVEVLVEIGQRAGVPDTRLDELRKFLALDEGKLIVDDEIRNGRRQYGVKGVPFFIVSSVDPNEEETSSSPRPYGFSGAQSTETFLELFEELADA